jgi:hypothetical protein
VLVLACLVPPAVETVREDAGLARATTREAAAAWIRGHLPRGARIVKESYTPELPPEEYAITEVRYAGRLAPDELRQSGNDYLLLASDAYQRFLRPDLTVKEHQRRIGEHYRAILDGWRPLAEWVPGDTRLGPILKLYRLEPLPADCRPGADLPPAEAFASARAMRPPAPDEAGPLRYGAAGQWSLVKACLPAGAYTVAVQGKIVGQGSLRVVGLAGPAGAEVARAPLAGGRTSTSSTSSWGRGASSPGSRSPPSGDLRSTAAPARRSARPPGRSRSARRRGPRCRSPSRPGCRPAAPRRRRRGASGTPA